MKRTLLASAVVAGALLAAPSASQAIAVGPCNAYGDTPSYSGGLARYGAELDCYPHVLNLSLTIHLQVQNGSNYYTVAGTGDTKSANAISDFGVSNVWPVTGGHRYRCEFTGTENSDPATGYTATTQAP